ncbi:MAG: hypothetical protein Q8P01_00615 [bacterium]|nr:hypothetical protein [bacterium]
MQVASVNGPPPTPNGTSASERVHILAAFQVRGSDSARIMIRLPEGATKVTLYEYRKGELIKAIYGPYEQTISIQIESREGTYEYVVKIDYPNGKSRLSNIISITFRENHE